MDEIWVMMVELQGKDPHVELYSSAEKAKRRAEWIVDSEYRRGDSSLANMTWENDYDDEFFFVTNGKGRNKGLVVSTVTYMQVDHPRGNP